VNEKKKKKKRKKVPVDTKAAASIAPLSTKRERPPELARRNQ
jgi:hypothetical protein